jgi:ferric-dicitrate binding protein FerR (iron transport regulator)
MDANKMIEEVLAARILSGEATAAEMALHSAQLQNDAKYRDDWEAYLAVWMMSGDALVLEDVDTEKAWSKVKEVTFSSVKVSRRRFTLLRYAALMTGVIVAAALWWLWPGGDVKSPSEMVAGGDLRQELKLEDGTHVTLNAGSRLVYNEPFMGQERRVRLSGEAWFDVAPDAQSPFFVETDDLVIRVVGTDFNVRSFTGVDVSQVEVGSGIVEVYSLAGANETVRLVAGDGVIYHRAQHQLAKVKANPNFLAWKTGRIQFKETPMSEVLETLERVYHQPIKVYDASILDEQLGGSFNNTTFDYVLDVVCKTFNLEHQTENGVVYLSRR